MNKALAEEIMSSAYATKNYIERCEFDVRYASRSAGPALPDAIPGFTESLERRLPVIKEATGHYVNGDDVYKQFEKFVSDRKGLVYAFNKPPVKVT